jgi:hypothetical protein
MELSRIHQTSLYLDRNKYIPINFFDLAGYIPNLFEHEPLNVYGSFDTVIFGDSENDCNNPIFHAEPEIPKPWVEYYRQSALNGELLSIHDLVFIDNWQEYHSWADEWECCSKENDKTEW